MTDLTDWATSNDREVTIIKVVNEFINGMPWDQIAKKYGYNKSTLRLLIRDFVMSEKDLEVIKRKFAARQLRKFKLKSLK